MQAFFSEVPPKILLVPAVDSCERSFMSFVKGKPYKLGQVTEDGKATFDVGPPSRVNPIDECCPVDECLLLYTSGTTGRPKTISLTQSNILTAVTNVVACCELSAKDLGLLVMPLFHVHGLVGGLLAPLAAGGGVVIDAQFDAGTFWENMAKHEITWYTAIPAIHHRVLNSVPPTGTVPRLRFVRSCSAKLAPSLAKELTRTFQGVVVSAYGMTEASHQITSTTISQASTQEWTTVGISPYGGIRIMGENGDVLSPGHVGEIVIKGNNVIAAYRHGDPEARAFTGEGYLLTGDLGMVDKHGQLIITGRRQELINRGGEMISPYEIEEALLRSEQIGEACAFGVPDPELGEVIGVVLVPNRGANIRDWRDIHRHLQESLAPCKHPSKVNYASSPWGGPVLHEARRYGCVVHFGPIPLGKSNADVWPSKSLGLAVILTGTSS
jgi:acyl-CoA synthetase (AMP-forming)/AMP-acid ligase II